MSKHHAVRDLPAVAAALDVAECPLLPYLAEGSAGFAGDRAQGHAVLGRSVGRHGFREFRLFELEFLVVGAGAHPRNHGHAGILRDVQHVAHKIAVVIAVEVVALGHGGVLDAYFAELLRGLHGVEEFSRRAVIAAGPEVLQGVMAALFGLLEHPKLRFCAGIGRIFDCRALHHDAVLVFERHIAMRDDHAVATVFHECVVHLVHARRGALDFLDVRVLVVIEVVDVHGTAVGPAARRVRAVVHKIPVPEILENGLVVRLGIVELVVQHALLRPGAVNARSHRVVRSGRIARRIAEVVVAAILVHPRGLEKVLDLDVFGGAVELDHVLLELHAAARVPRAPIHPDVVAVVENRGVDIEFHIVRGVVGNEGLPDGVDPRARGMVGHGDADGKTFAPVFLDGAVVHGHVPVELAVTVFAVAGEGARVRPLEGLHAQNRTVVVVVLHVVGHEHVPVVHHEHLVAIALRTLLVVARENEQAVVIHERRRVGGIERRRERIRSEGDRGKGKDDGEGF